MNLHLGVYCMRHTEQNMIMALNDAFNAMVVVFIYMMHGI